MTSIEPSTPAAADLRVGDLVVALGGTPVEDVDAVHRELVGRAIGVPLTITVVRDRALRDVTVVPIGTPAS